MEFWLIWGVAGLVMALLEIVLPGGIVVFLGAAAIAVSAALKFGIMTSPVNAFIAWFITSIVFILFLRSFFMKYFEGDSSVQDVDESKEGIGGIVEVVETIYPHKEGRVRFRDSTWGARSSQQIDIGQKAIIEHKDQNIWIVKSLEN